MFDAVTLDQLRALVTVSETGSFSAAARRLGRVQSAISQAMTNLESQLGLALWDRTTKLPTLTDAGRTVLAAAGRVLATVDSLQGVVAGMADGLEPAVVLCVDALFPTPALVELCQGFAQAFPTVSLRVETEAMSAVAARVLGGQATLGVASPLGVLPGLARQVLSPVQMVPVVAAGHPLGRVRGRVPLERLKDEVQIVLSERSEAGVADQAVLSPRTWRVSDLHTKLALLVGGLGWGNLPLHMIRAELRRGRLRRIQPESWADDEHRLYLSAVYRTGATFGPAHRWVLAHLGTLCQRELEGSPPRHPATRRGDRPRRR